MTAAVAAANDDVVNDEDDADMLYIHLQSVTDPVRER